MESPSFIFGLNSGYSNLAAKLRRSQVVINVIENSWESVVDHRLREKRVKWELNL